MPKSKQQKEEIVKVLDENIAKQTAMVFVNFARVNVKDISAFRKSLKQEHAELLVAKKTLLQRALSERGIVVDMKALQGQIGVVFAYEDPVTAIKNCDKNIEIVGGYFESEIQEQNHMKAIARLPSKDELLARLVGSIAAPLSGFANVLQGNIKGLVIALGAIGNSKQ